VRMAAQIVTGGWRRFRGRCSKEPRRAHHVGVMAELADLTAVCPWR
jgi:hypothetical protein